MLEKLRRYGLPDWIVRWLQSYLTDRKASVKVRCTLSRLLTIPSGVPQGSIIGPLLFILFVNDLGSILESDKLMYADDLKIFRSVSSPLDSCALQQDVDRLLHWCDANGMTANAQKCKIISFARKRTPLLSSYSMGLNELERVSSIVDLGVTIDSKACFNEHIALTTSKAFATLGFLRRNAADFVDLHALKTVYCSLVRSQLEYAVQVWAPYYAVQAERIERIQRAFAKFALRRIPWVRPQGLSSYDDNCQRLGLYTLASRRVMLQRTYIFDLLSVNIDCAALRNKVSLHVPTRTLRNPAPFLEVPGHRTNYGFYSPLSACCRLFNVVADVFVFGMSKTLFKTRIKDRI